MFNPYNSYPWPPTIVPKTTQLLAKSKEIAERLETERLARKPLAPTRSAINHLKPPDVSAILQKLKLATFNNSVDPFNIENGAPSN